MDQITLSDCISQYFKENMLPFYLRQNTADGKLYSIRKTSWSEGYAMSSHEYIGFISNRQNKACIGHKGISSDWLDVKDPTFFEKFHNILKERT